MSAAISNSCRAAASFMRRAQPVQQLVALAVEKEPHVADLLGVGLARDRQHAGRRAALDLVLQAGAPPVVQHVIGAGAQLEVTIDHPQRLAAGRRRVVGPEVVGPVVPDPADDLQPRPFPVGIEAQHQEVLVVRQLDVEAGLVPLDERVLEQQRLFLVRGHHRLDVGDDPVQQRDEVAGVARGRLEILPDAVAQHGRLADVDRLAAPVLHDVDAGRGGQRLQDLRQASCAAASPRLRASSGAAHRRVDRRLRTSIQR